jgi:hypothetical protein
MKKTFLSFSLCALLLNSGKAIAQNNTGQVIINTGVGFSLFGQLSSISQGNDGYNAQPTSATPVFSCSVDYGISSGFSYGGGISVQSFKTYIEVQNPGYIYQYQEDDVTFTNINVRGFYHILPNNKIIDFYTGISMGYSFWSQTVSNGNNPDYSISYPSFMVLIGIRGYITNVVGFYIELGLGTPYCAETGLSFRLNNGNKQFTGQPSVKKSLHADN